MSVNTSQWDQWSGLTRLWALGVPSRLLGHIRLPPWHYQSEALWPKTEKSANLDKPPPKKTSSIFQGLGRFWVFFFPPLLLSLSCCLSVEPPFLGLALMHIKDKHLRHGRGCHSPPDNCWYIHSPESVIVLVFLLSNPCLLPSSAVCLLATESPLPSLGSSLPIYYPSYVFYFKSNK